MKSIRSPACGLPSYQYAALNAGINEARLAELQPGEFDDDIYLKIRSVALKSSDECGKDHPSFSVDDLQKDLPTDWTVRETINGRFIFERKREYGPREAYETFWEHPRAKFEPIANNYNLVYTKPEYEALSHAWGPREDQTIVFIQSSRPCSSDYGFSFAAIEQERSYSMDSQPGTKRFADDMPIISSPKRLDSGTSSYDARSQESVHNLEPALSFMTIQSEVAVALRYLRYKKRPRTFWIDNVCINQNDIKERNYLVRHMGQIYRFAQKTIVWLGPEHSNCELAMSKLDYLGRQVEITNKGSWRVNAPGCLEPTWSRTAVPLPWTSEDWDAISNLLERPWFKRLWVWQEAKLSNDESIIQCGDQKMELYRFGAAAWCAAAKANSIRPGLQNLLFQAGDAVLRQFDEPFLNTLLHLTGKDCSDPRDKIYGALGVAPLQIASKIVPNYYKEVEEVYSEAAIALCRATGRVDFLLACNLATRALGGPSWVPDWAIMQRRSPRWHLSTTLASGISVARAKFERAPKPALLVQGVECGTICSVGKRAPSLTTQEPPISELYSVIRSWAPPCLENEMYVTKTKTESLLDAFVKTVHWNTLRERCPLDPSLPTLAEAREAIRGILHDQDTEGSDPARRQNQPKLTHNEPFFGRCYIELDNGYIGLTSASAEETDIVCVILGCPLPMILRPHSSGRYQVVGPTYIHGLVDAESLLGPLDSDYVVQVGTLSGWYGGSDFRNVKTGEVVEEDPRLGEVSPTWVRTEAIRTSTDPLHFTRFRNLSSGKTINGDPRLLPDALRERGVPVKPLKLV